MCSSFILINNKIIDFTGALFILCIHLLLEHVITGRIRGRVDFNLFHKKAPFFCFIQFCVKIGTWSKSQR